jgi:hypothetical protein
LFADAKSCPLLKEYAISFLTTYAQEVAIWDYANTENSC